MADQQNQKRPRIVIVGAGFGGVKLAKLFAKEDVDVMLVDHHNFQLFQPLLYQVSTAVLSTDEIAYPVRTFFRKCKNVEFFMAKAEGVDQARKVLLTNHGELAYDYLILAAGATTNYFGMKEVEEHSYGMKTLQEALHIRNHVLHMFERANKETDPEVRRRMLTFVVVGGGPTGIEESGALTGFSASSGRVHNSTGRSQRQAYRGGNVAMVAPNLREHAVKVLRKKGVDVMLNTQVVGYDGNDLKLKDGTTIPTQTVIWAAGVKAVPFIKDCGGEVDRGGRIIVNEKLQVEGSDCVFAIGDCAHYQHGTERPLPTVAPVAMQQAQTAHDNIMKLIRGQQDLATFHYRPPAPLATIVAAASIVDKTKMNPQMTGFLAWCAWMFVHLLRLAGAHANFTVAIKWTWNLFSGTRLGRIITNIKD